MKIVIDRNRCTGHGRCYVLAPTLFEADDDGFGQLLESKVERRVGASEGADARLAMLNCPEQAITIDDR